MSLGGICGKNDGKLKSCYYDQTKYMMLNIYGFSPNSQISYYSSNDTTNNDEAEGKGVNSSEIKTDYTVGQMNLESIGSGVIYSLNLQNEVLTKELDDNWTDSDFYTIRPAGWGSQGDPYLIAIPENLAWVAKNMNGFSGFYYKQTADIDLSAHFWVPFNFLKSTYDGGGYTIKRLTISEDHESNGLFSQSINSTIKNVNISNSGISYKPVGATFAGGIAGTINGGIILNSTSNISISITEATNSYVGEL